MKAEGGWGVVNTEYCSIHPSSDDTPYPLCPLWDDERYAAPGADDRGGASPWRAGRLSSSGIGGNHDPPTSPPAQPPLDLISIPLARSIPMQIARAWTRQDIRDFLRWQRDAAQARHARRASTSSISMPAHGYLLHHFLSRRQNPRSDEYGGSLAEPRPAAARDDRGDDARPSAPTARWRCASPSTSCIGEAARSPSASMPEMVAILAELPDLWDVNISDD